MEGLRRAKAIIPNDVEIHEATHFCEEHGCGLRRVSARVLEKGHCELDVTLLIARRNDEARKTLDHVAQRDGASGGERGPNARQLVKIGGESEPSRRFVKRDWLGAALRFLGSQDPTRFDEA